jgi:hypothetical protein
VAESLYRKAATDGPQSVTAAIFWLKTRAGWKELVSHELSGPDGGPIRSEDMTPRDLARRIAFLLAVGEQSA